MKPTIAHILAALNEIAPAGLAEEWDKIGLMVGSLETEVSGILTALDPSLEAVEAAAESGADCLVTHHPLLFKPLEVVDTASPVGGVVAEAIRRGVAIVAAHTNLDSASGGVNDVLAERVGLVEPAVLAPKAESETVGLGRVGRLVEPETLGRLAGRVKEALEAAAVRVVGDLEASVERVAVCGGSAGGLIEAALRAEAQVIVTGEMGYHDALTARAVGLNVIEAGHYATEAPVVPVLAERLTIELNRAGFAVTAQVHAGRGEPYAAV